MRLNRFFTKRDVDAPLLRRIYARVDRAEKIEGDKVGFALFDGVDADWMDDEGFQIFDRDEFFRYVPLAVVEFKRTIEMLGSYGKLPTLFANTEYEDGAAGWFEVLLSAESDSNGDALVYRSLHDDPLEQSDKQNLKDISPVGHGLGRQLDKAFSLDWAVTASVEDIQNLLGRIGPVDFAGVYDVGQGSCSGLCDSDSSVLGYLDFGGGIFGNRGTFPKDLEHFCFTHRPPVILSHWDFDHWSSVHRDNQRAFHADWLVPLQLDRDGAPDMGPSHITFAWQVHCNGRLLWWPNRLDQISAGQITIKK